MTEPEGLWPALMRRKVVKTVLFYLAFAWLAIQVASLIAGIWSLPTGFVQNLFLLLMIGLPVVAVLSWVYDLRDDRLVESRGAGFRELLTRGLRTHPLRVTLALLAFTAIGLVAIAYAWPDEELSHDAKRLLATLEQRNDDDPQNLLLGLFGFGAPPGADIWDHGSYLVTNQAILGVDPLTGYDDGFTVTTTDLCALWLASCTESLLAEQQGVPALIAANAAPLARYRVLREARSFNTPSILGVASGSLSLHPLMVGNRLELMQALDEAEHGDPAAAAARLAAESAFHHRMMARSDTILSKMIAIALIQNDVRFAALLAERAAHRPGRTGFPTATPPRLTQAERSLVWAMAHEGAGLIRLATREDSGRDDMRMVWFEGPGSALFRLLPFRRNATLNKSLDRYMDAISASLLSAKEFADLPKRVTKEPSLLDLYTNTAGELMLANETDWRQYVERCHDLDALIVLAQVAHRLHAERVKPGELAGALLALPPELRDPFNGAAPVWRDGKLEFSRAVARERKGTAPWLPFMPSG